MVVVGAGAIGMAVTANTTIQLAVPDQLRGRVMSVYTTVFAGSVPAGGLLMGWIASAWGVPLALLVGALASLAVGLRRRPGSPDPPIGSGRPGAAGGARAERVAASAPRPRSGESPLTVARRRRAPTSTSGATSAANRSAAATISGDRHLGEGQGEVLDAELGELADLRGDVLRRAAHRVVRASDAAARTRPGPAPTASASAGRPPRPPRG